MCLWHGQGAVSPSGVGFFMEVVEMRWPLFEGVWEFLRFLCRR
jgi:hypothetical protein